MDFLRYRRHLMERKAGNVEIGIWNHLDVVPEGKEWIYPPYTCTEKDGFLIGRGIQDNKGPAVAVLYAMKYCSEKEILNNCASHSRYFSDELDAQFL